MAANRVQYRRGALGRLIREEFNSRRPVRTRTVSLARVAGGGGGKAGSRRTAKAIALSHHREMSRSKQVGHMAIAAGLNAVDPLHGSQALGRRFHGRALACIRMSAADAREQQTRNSQAEKSNGGVSHAAMAA
jgi:hypothetical protein